MALMGPLASQTSFGSVSTRLITTFVPVTSDASLIFQGLACDLSEACQSSVAYPRIGGGIPGRVEMQHTLERGILEGARRQLLSELPCPFQLLWRDAMDFGTTRHRRDDSNDKEFGGTFTTSFADHPGPIGFRNRDIPLLRCTAFAFVLGLPSPIPDAKDPPIT